MKICENCGTSHSGDYGSGRFCNIKCSRSFSTKSKRIEINEKVSNTLSKKSVKHCPICDSEFNTSRKTSIYCSKSCAGKSPNNKGWSNHSKTDWSTVHKKAYAKGTNYVAGGTTKWYPYKNIKVQGTYEVRTCIILDKLKELKLIKNWKYASKRIPYSINGEIHSYTIDFEIILNDDTFKYIEVKGRIREADEEKWKAARSMGLLLEIWFNEDICNKENQYLK